MTARGYSSTVPTLREVPYTSSEIKRRLAEVRNEDAKRQAQLLFYVHSMCRRGPLR